MKRVLGVVFLLHVSLWAEMLVLDNFHANVFGKTDKKPVELSLGLIVEGATVKRDEHKVVDALNIVIGSYYAEDLVTSRGKEVLKSTLIVYAKKVHSLTIDTVYIKDLTIKINPSVKEIVDAIKKEGVFQQNATPKQQQPKQESYLAPPLPKKLPLPDENAVNF